MPTVKCRQCGNKVDRNSAVKMANGYYFCTEKCAEQWQDGHKPRPKQSADKDGRKRLLDYIQSIAPDANMRLVGIQLAQMIKANPDMTYGGILYTLYWLRDNGYDIVQSPLGLVKYKYDAAKDHFQWRQGMKQQIASWQQNDDEVEIVKKPVDDEVFD